MHFIRVFSLILFAVSVTAVQAQQLTIVQRKPDPHGSPRPAKNAEHVPVRTSLYFELKLVGKTDAPANDVILAESVTIDIAPENGAAIRALKTGKKFTNGYSGRLRPRAGRGGSNYENVASLAVYVDPDVPLKPATRYTVTVSAASRGGAVLPGHAGVWSFNTAADYSGSLSGTLDFNSEPVTWHGQFFSGLCNVLFCSSESYLPTFELMDAARQKHPRAWSYQREFWMTGFNRESSAFGVTLPNIVRERESRRVRSMTQQSDGVLLHVEDFFGHEQYGIESNRPVSGDYHPGDIVLVADPQHSEQATVIAVDDSAGTVLVSSPDKAPESWKVDYTGPLPTTENPDMPGLFPSGGCNLMKYKPHGTAVYYWGRLDKEWDLQHTRFGRRLLPNFADAPGDLARDGRNWTAPKDYAQYHAAVRDITGHLIERYGEDCLQFTWSVFNEPDLGGLFWRADWDELQTFYDYTVDGILRAFEDQGLDSSQVFVGGLELGGIFGTNLKLSEFLAHCSPTATAPGAVLLNAAFADERLNGKRSRRVEELCSKNDGHGSPCDFVSVHAYNGAESMVAKLTRAKETALEIDADYFRDLWVNSHESCPEWSLPPDEAAADSYRGNGFAETWCVDVAYRQLQQAARDSRYGFGETLFTVWPPVANFAGANAVTRNISVDDDGDGRRDRTVTIASPIFHVMTLLSDFKDDFRLLPVQTVGGHNVSGFANRDTEGNIRVMLYAHHAEDPQSRSDVQFRYKLTLNGLPAAHSFRVQEHRIDRTHNSYFEQMERMRNAGHDRLDAAVTEFDGLRSDDPVERQTALEKLLNHDVSFARTAAPEIARRVRDMTDEEFQDASRMIAQWLGMGSATPAKTVAEIEQLSKLTVTKEFTTRTTGHGRLNLSADIFGNGVNMLMLAPE